MNVVLVVVDALRATDVGCLGREDEITPHIDDLATESMTFERAFTLSNKTDVAMSSLLSGRAPREHGVLYHGTVHTEENLQRIEERSPTFLPELLQNDGYETIGVDWLGRWHAWGYDRYGVDEIGDDDEGADGSVLNDALEFVKDRVTDLPDPLLAPIMRQYYRRVGYIDERVDCKRLTDIAIDRMNDADEPFFTLLHYWDVHPPYLPPEEFESRFEYDGEDEHLSNYFGPDAKGPLSAEYQPYATGDHRTLADSKEAYDGAVAWVDQQFGRLLEYLRDQNLLDETMVIVTADHGHNFGEHGIFSDNSGLYDTSVHIPLIVHDPRHGPERVNGLVQHTDVVPTILDYAGVQSPDNLRGSVLPETREYVFAEAVESRMQMIRTDEWKLIRPDDIDYLRDQHWYDSDGEIELYDLVADPDETTNLAADNPEMVERLRELLEDELEIQEQVALSGSRRNVEYDEDEMDDLQDRLQALGYADDDHV